MKTLTLIRHAKSSWKDPNLADRLRPLNKRGKRDGPAMGRRLAKRGVEVDLMISSPATRALATAEAIAQEIGYPDEEILVDETLYHADALELLEIIQGLDDDFDHVMCFGHNPGLTELVNDLSYEVENVPTCGIVEFTFDTDSWVRIGDLEATHVAFDYPKRTVQ